jgi:hypothetical protein
MAADQRRLTPMKTHILIGVHQRLSAAHSDFLTAFQGAVSQLCNE